MPAHLKEDDQLISFIRESVATDAEGRILEGAVLKAFELASEYLREHYEALDAKARSQTRLKKICPDLSPVFLPLDLSAALKEYDVSHGLTRRVFVAPSHREIRQVLNLSVVHAASSRHRVKLVTLDLDGTVYQDGAILEATSPLIPILIRLMRLGINVAFVTAAAYIGEPQKFEARLQGFLKALGNAIEAGASPDILKHWLVMGGECNQLVQPVCEADADGLNPVVRLKEIPDEVWKDGRGVRWSHRAVKDLLDEAETCLKSTAERLGLDVLIIRKARACGLISNPKASMSQARISYENLEEIALTVQHHLTAKVGHRIPFCAFNGGADSFCDVGSKALGIRALQATFGATPETTIHIGDRFTRTGNDLKAREFANTLWVGGDGPAETEYLLSLLIQGIRNNRGVAAGEGGFILHGPSDPQQTAVPTSSSLDNSSLSQQQQQISPLPSPVPLLQHQLSFSVATGGGAAAGFQRSDSALSSPRSATGGGGNGDGGGGTSTAPGPGPGPGPVSLLTGPPPAFVAHGGLSASLSSSATSSSAIPALPLRVDVATAPSPAPSGSLLPTPAHVAGTSAGTTPLIVPAGFSHKVQTESGQIADVVRTPALGGAPMDAEAAASLSSFDLDEIQSSKTVEAVHPSQPLEQSPQALAGTTAAAAIGDEHLPSNTAASLAKVTGPDRGPLEERLSRAPSTGPEHPSHHHHPLHNQPHHHHHHHHLNSNNPHGANAPSSVYGLTQERARLQAPLMAKEALRSQWQSAGGVIAAEIRASPLSVSGASPAFSAWSGSPSLGHQTGAAAPVPSVIAPTAVAARPSPPAQPPVDDTVGNAGAGGK